LRKWKRKVDIWLKRVKNYLPPNEQALELLGALTGPAEEELSTVDPDVFDHPDGVKRLIAKFEVHCKEESVVRQSIAINAFETLVRTPGMSMTKYITAWRQAKMKIKDAGIQPYPDEVRAARLLEGAKITEQSRQIIMTTAGNTENFFGFAAALSSLCSWSERTEGTHRGPSSAEPPSQQGPWQREAPGWTLEIICG
jgi:hypothetical protein